MCNKSFKTSKEEEDKERNKNLTKFNWWTKYC